MTATRATRAVTVRPASTTRDITKRRDKPYKTEHNRVLTKKKKLKLNTSYYAQAPPGFQFLPVGTPDLAERCKELSRQRALQVNVVNAKPSSRQHTDPDKISHHIHRIGYHFRVEVLDEACQDLGYISYRDHFVKPEDLEQKYEESKMAKAMAKHGLHLIEPAQRETNEQVRGAIKELFPKIPEADLEAIVSHAWEEGTDRVGTNARLGLARRVQLATIARIRHMYTDYDRLLRAFEWKDARGLVEPTCLAKLIQWRGEKDDVDDDELEEIIQETIVIDDDDDDDAINPKGSGADDDDSAELEYTSDTSLEISHKLAGADDLGAESHDENSRRRILSRYNLQPRNQQRYLDVRQKIDTVREQMRNGTWQQPQPQVIQIKLPENSDTVMIDGQLYRRTHTPALLPPVEMHSTPAQTMAPYPKPQSGVYDDGRQPVSQTRASTQHYLRQTEPPDPYALRDRPVASIEPTDDMQRMALVPASATEDELRYKGTRANPATPDSERFEKRRRMDPLLGSSSNVNLYYSRRPVDPRPSAVHNHQSGRASATAPSNKADQSQYPQIVGSPQYTSPQSSLPDHLQVQYQRAGAARPLQTYRPGIVDAQAAPVQYMPLGQNANGSPIRPLSARYGGPSFPQAYQQQPKVIYLPQRTGYTPQPVHGAPAPVQQVMREHAVAPQRQPQQVANAGYSVPPPSFYPPPPAGYTTPPQYYYPR